jgi:membrane protein
LKTLRTFFRLSRQAFTRLQSNDPVRMAGATAFFTFFALPPIVVILSGVLSPVVNQQRFTFRLFEQFARVFGPQSASQLQAISENLKQEKANFAVLALSGLILLLASTTLFAVVQNSLNQLWNVKAKPRLRVVHHLKDRTLALGLIVYSGLLFVTFRRLGHYARRLTPYVVPGSFVPPDWVVAVGDFIVSVAVLTVWIAIIFKYLPDVRVRWRAVWLGAAVTSLLFKVGELVLNRLLIQGPLGALYGASGAVILMLLFVFYSALIFYFGAAFTRTYAEFSHLDSPPKPDAVGYAIKELKTAGPGQKRKNRKG